jgi:peptide deformylase
MAVREVLLYPHPLLKQICQPVDDDDDELEQLIADLTDTLSFHPGCVGIAAPQIGHLRRVVVVDASRNRKPVPNRGLTVLINPEIEMEEGEEIMREGCLSIPEFTANVKRAKLIRVSTLSDGTRIRFDTADFEARVIQHEMDHLDGKLFLDRCASLKTDVFRRKRFSPPE